MFSLAATATMAFNAAIWSKEGWLNIFLKMLFTGMSLWGVFETAKVFGYIVKP